LPAHVCLRLRFSLGHLDRGPPTVDSRPDVRPLLEQTSRRRDRTHLSAPRTRSQTIPRVSTSRRSTQCWLCGSIKERTLDTLRWGLVPHWANDLKLGSRTTRAPRRWGRSRHSATPSKAGGASSRRAVSTSGKRRVAPSSPTPSYPRASNCSPSPAYGRTGATMQVAKARSGSGHAPSSASPTNCRCPSTTECR
jgi:hypothetical protein